MKTSSYRSSLGFTEICSPNQTWHTEAIIKPNDFVGIGIFNKKDPWVTNSSVRVVPMDSQKYIMFTDVFKSGIIKMIELIKYLLKGENYEKKIKYVS